MKVIKSIFLRILKGPGVKGENYSPPGHFIKLSQITAVEERQVLFSDGKGDA